MTIGQFRKVFTMRNYIATAIIASCGTYLLVSWIIPSTSEYVLVRALNTSIQDGDRERQVTTLERLCAMRAGDNRYRRLLAETRLLSAIALFERGLRVDGYRELDRAIAAMPEHPLCYYVYASFLDEGIASDARSFMLERGRAWYSIARQTNALGGMQVDGIPVESELSIAIWASKQDDWLIVEEILSTWAMREAEAWTALGQMEKVEKVRILLDGDISVQRAESLVDAVDGRLRGS